MTALASHSSLVKKGCPSFVVAVLGWPAAWRGYQAGIGFGDGRHRYDADARLPAGAPVAGYFRRAGKALAMGLLGAAVYFAVPQFEIHRYNIELSDKGGLERLRRRQLLERAGQAKFCRPIVISGLLHPLAPTIPARCCW